MPVYEYRCRACGHQFDVQQSFTDDALTQCPECRGELRKVFAPVGISFKGSGFYKTDSRSGSGSTSSSSTASGSSSSGADSGSSSSDSGTSSSTGSGGSDSSSTATTTPSTSSSTD